MYRTTRETLARALIDLERHVDATPGIIAWAEAARPSPVEGRVSPTALAEERLIERLFQATSDIGLIIVEWVVHREAGGYDEMVDILLQEGAIMPTTAAGIRELTESYRVISRDYLTRRLDTRRALTAVLPALRAFIREVRAFLAEERVDLADVEDRLIAEDGDGHNQA
ncbi:MAG: hypothetical protein IMW86_01540 [Hydrogenibacillus sp.]|nr:hypothetical protein [Hydrogenibacillus sp.]